MSLSPVWGQAPSSNTSQGTGVVQAGSMGLRSKRPTASSEWRPQQIHACICTVTQSLRHWCPQAHGRGDRYLKTV